MDDEKRQEGAEPLPAHVDGSDAAGEVPPAAGPPALDDATSPALPPPVVPGEESGGWLPPPVEGYEVPGAPPTLTGGKVAAQAVLGFLAAVFVHFVGYAIVTAAGSAMPPLVIVLGGGVLVFDVLILLWMVRRGWRFAAVGYAAAFGMVLLLPLLALGLCLLSFRGSMP